MKHQAQFKSFKLVTIFSNSRVLHIQRMKYEIIFNKVYFNHIKHKRSFSLLYHFVIITTSNLVEKTFIPPKKLNWLKLNKDLFSLFVLWTPPKRNLLVIMLLCSYTKYVFKRLTGRRTNVPVQGARGYKQLFLNVGFRYK